MTGVRALQCTSPPPSCSHLSSFQLYLVITVIIFFILFFLRAKRKRVIVFLDEWMVGQMDERMDGHNLIDRQHDITAPPESQGSVLALTVRDVRGKPMEEEKQEVMCNSLYSYSVKTQTTTEGKQIPSALYNIIKLVWVIFVSHRLY